MTTHEVAEKLRRLIPPTGFGSTRSYLANPDGPEAADALTALLDENERMREARVQAVSLEGMQGEPAGMMTVRVHMTDGQSFDLIRSNGTVISHWARIPDAEARAALSPTQPEEVK